MRRSGRPSPRWRRARTSHAADAPPTPRCDAAGATSGPASSRQIVHRCCRATLRRSAAEDRSCWRRFRRRWPRRGRRHETGRAPGRRIDATLACAPRSKRQPPSRSTGRRSASGSAMSQTTCAPMQTIAFRRLPLVASWRDMAAICLSASALTLSSVRTASRRRDMRRCGATPRAVAVGLVSAAVQPHDTELVDAPSRLQKRLGDRLNRRRPDAPESPCHPAAARWCGRLASRSPPAVTLEKVLMSTGWPSSLISKVAAVDRGRRCRAVEDDDVDLDQVDAGGGGGRLWAMSGADTATAAIASSSRSRPRPPRQRPARQEDVPSRSPPALWPSVGRPAIRPAEPIAHPRHRSPTHVPATRTAQIVDDDEVILDAAVARRAECDRAPR